MRVVRVGSFSARLPSTEPSVKQDTCFHKQEQSRLRRAPATTLLLLARSSRQERAVSAARAAPPGPRQPRERRRPCAPCGQTRSSGTDTGRTDRRDRRVAIGIAGSGRAGTIAPGMRSSRGWRGSAERTAEFGRLRSCANPLIQLDRRDPSFAEAQARSSRAADTNATVSARIRRTIAISPSVSVWAGARSPEDLECMGPALRGIEQIAGNLIVLHVDATGSPAPSVAPPWSIPRITRRAKKSPPPLECPTYARSSVPLVPASLR